MCFEGLTPVTLYAKTHVKKSLLDLSFKAPQDTQPVGYSVLDPS